MGEPLRSPVLVQRAVHNLYCQSRAAIAAVRAEQ